MKEQLTTVQKQNKKIEKIYPPPTASTVAFRLSIAVANAFPDKIFFRNFFQPNQLLREFQYTQNLVLNDFSASQCNLFQCEKDQV